MSELIIIHRKCMHLFIEIKGCSLYLISIVKKQIKIDFLFKSNITYPTVLPYLLNSVLARASLILQPPDSSLQINNNAFIVFNINFLQYVPWNLEFVVP